MNLVLKFFFVEYTRYAFCFFSILGQVGMGCFGLRSAVPRCVVLCRLVLSTVLVYPVPASIRCVLSIIGHFSWVSIFICFMSNNILYQVAFYDISWRQASCHDDG